MIRDRAQERTLQPASPPGADHNRFGRQFSGKLTDRCTGLSSKDADLVIRQSELVLRRPDRVVGGLSSLRDGRRTPPGRARVQRVQNPPRRLRRVHP